MADVATPTSLTEVPNGGRSLSSLTGGAPVATGSTPYDSFNAIMMDALAKAKATGQANQTGLLTQQQNLENESLNLANPLSADNPYAPYIKATGGGAPAVQADTLGAFAPGKLSIENTLTANNTATQNATDLINSEVNAEKPTATPIDSNITSPGGQVITSGFNPNLNPATGLPYGYGGPTGNNGGSSPLVGGIDLTGKTTGVGSYATDPNYAKEVGSIYGALTTAMPAGANGPSIDNYIDSHASSSPITGAMILNASQAYGIDPLALTAVLAQESDFGTAGAGAKTFNAGNVGNTDDGTTRTFGSWQQGVNAAASELAKRMPGNPNAPKNDQNPTSPVGGQFSQAAEQKISAIPAALQSYVDAGPQGIAYINDDRVPAQYKTVMQAQASAAGIPYVTSADASAIKAIGVVMQSIDKMNVLVNNNLSGGEFGRGLDVGKTVLNNLFQTNPSLTKFDSYRDTAIKTVQALAGGAGSGLRINGSEIDANVQNLPQSTDNLETAQAKLSQIKTFLNQQLAATFPYVNQANGKITVNVGGTNYSSGSTLSNGKLTLTVGTDGTLIGSDGNTYDTSGNQIQ